jgi:hypothetical protein
MSALFTAALDLLITCQCVNLSVVTCLVLSVQHDHVFFLGDMNYRVDLPFDRCVTLYNQRQFGALMAHDQLVREHHRGKIFHGFHEGRVDFPPSYRWERDAEEFSWKRGQAPSYTDRILWRSLPGLLDRIVCEEYKSATFMFGSDHRPVFASFLMRLQRYYSAPSLPASFVPYPVPTFFSSYDMLALPVPVLWLSNLRITFSNPLTAPAAISLTVYAPWLEGGPVTTATMAASGLTPVIKTKV